MIVMNKVFSSDIPVIIFLKYDPQQFIADTNIARYKNNPKLFSRLYQIY